MRLARPRERSAGWRLESGPKCESVAAAFSGFALPQRMMYGNTTASRDEPMSSQRARWTWLVVCGAQSDASAGGRRPGRELAVRLARPAAGLLRALLEAMSEGMTWALKLWAALADSQIAEKGREQRPASSI